MKVIGIVGGIGAGKSTVVALMNEIKPIHSISADLIGHEILRKGQKGYRPVIEAFGESILDESGEIVRERLAKMVFGNPGRLEKLNAITHPLITEIIKERIVSYQQIAPSQHIVLEAALLIESGLIQLTDVVIAVYAEVSERTKRVMMRDGIDETQMIRRLKAQKEWEEIERVADYIIDNSISLEATKMQIQQILIALEEEEMG